jgi:hypothetical protein
MPVTGPNRCPPDRPAAVGIKELVLASRYHTHTPAGERAASGGCGAVSGLYGNVKFALCDHSWPWVTAGEYGLIEQSRTLPLRTWAGVPAAAATRATFMTCLGGDIRSIRSHREIDGSRVDMLVYVAIGQTG